MAAAHQQGSGLVIRRARRDDIADIVAMLADDLHGAGRENPDEMHHYDAAFDAIDADPNQLLAVAERNGSLVGTLQLTMVTGLSRKGAMRGQIESVRIDASLRGRGLGSELITWAIEEARRRGAALVQLTSSSSRDGAHRFYERLGFEATHVGFKLSL